MQNSLVSILIPFKNTEVLNSVINQIYTNWYLIIIDDFSSDNSNLNEIIATIWL